METKFKKGDLAKIRTSGETVMILEYKVNHAGSIYNHFLGRKEFDDAVVTDEVLCEGTIDKKFQRRYINEANLELVSAGIES
jgi:hypothetical protein